MRMRLVVVCFAVFCCCACSNPIQRGNLLQATYGAYGQPPGYYAGRAEPFGGDATEFRAWIAKNQQGIDEIQQRIAEIKERKRRPGCIGQDKLTCVATLAQKMAIADEYFLNETNVFATTKYDVNGKPLTGSTITFDGYPPNAKGDHINDHTDFLLRLNPQGAVASMLVHLPKNLATARTQEEYDATRVYEAISAVTSDVCPALGRDEVARWVENTIKPNSRFKPTKRLNDEEGHYKADELVSKKIVFCGRSFEIDTIALTRQSLFKHDTSVGTVMAID